MQMARIFQKGRYRIKQKMVTPEVNLVWGFKEDLSDWYRDRGDGGRGKWVVRKML